MNRSHAEPMEPDVRCLEAGPTGRTTHRVALEKKEVIGSGTRGIVHAVRVLFLDSDGSPKGVQESGFAYKQFFPVEDSESSCTTGPENRRKALEGYGLVAPSGLRTLSTFRPCGDDGILMTDLRAGGRLVLSPDNPMTSEYRMLAREKIQEIVGFDDFVDTVIRDVMAACATRPLRLTGDALFFLLKRLGPEAARSFSMDYAIGDFENVSSSIGKPVPAKNAHDMKWTIIRLLYELVSSPEPYIRRTQAIARSILGKE